MTGIRFIYELFIVGKGQADKPMDIDIAELLYLGVAGTGLLVLVLRLAFW
jgi:hypothetical protein